MNVIYYIGLSVPFAFSVYQSAQAASCPYCNYGNQTVPHANISTGGVVELSEAKPESGAIDFTRLVSVPTSSEKVPALVSEVILATHHTISNPKKCLPSVKMLWSSGNQEFGSVGGIDVVYGGRFRVNGEFLKLRAEKTCGTPLKFTVYRFTQKSLNNNFLKQ